jgi:hypothetical protein
MVAIGGKADVARIAHFGNGASVIINVESA